MNLNEFIGNYEYKYDTGDTWSILKPDDDGKYRGDCEDFALTVLWILCDQSWLKFWFKLILGNAKLCYVNNNGGHAVLKVGNEYIDNWTKRWVSKEYMEGLGHTFKPPLILWPHVFYNLIVKRGGR